MKKCLNCKRLLDLSQFNKRTKCKDKLQSYCRECASHISKKRYWEKTEYVKKKSRTYIYNRRKDIKYINICKRCFKRPVYKGSPSLCTECLKDFRNRHFGNKLIEKLEEINNLMEKRRNE